MAYGDPIDMVKGNYLYNSDDMKVGVGSYPHALTFQKIYSSGARTQKGPLGMGWGHNFDASTVVSSDGFQGMGADSALDAATTLVELMISLDLLTDTAKPLDKLVIATLGQRWFGDQLLDNTVIVRQGLNGEVFVKLPDGTYNAPPANSAKLIKNGDGTYTYETVNRDKLNFNPPPCGTGSNCKIATYNHASGVQVKFTYTGADLTQVQNSLGRTLTLTNTSGRITAVGDGSRSIDYAYDGSGNLSTFTDAAGKSTTFQYDLPGRMTKLFYPANPTLATITNVYDTLGRVKTQTNVHNFLYTYYFAGSRSEEVGPDNISNVSYIDGSGKVTKSINPKGKITNNAYDGQTRLAKTTFPEGNSVAYTYDDATCASTDKRCTQNVKTISRIAKPGSGLTTLVTSMTYESAFNKVASVTDPKGLVSSFTYTAQGNPLTVTRPADALGVQPASTYAYVSYTPSGYPTFYLPSSVTEKTSATNSVVTATTYNASNKYVPQTVTVDSGSGKLNLATTFTYNAIGDLTVVDGPRTDVSDITTTAYDNQRRPTQVTDALGKLTKYAYDADGNPIRSSTQIGSLWMVSCNTYTTSGKVLKAWGPGQTASDATCPTAAAPVRVTDYIYSIFDTPTLITENLTAGEGGNRTTQYFYHADGRLYSDTRAIGTATPQLYAYYFYTNNGRLNIVRDGKNNQTTYQYDGHDRLAKTSYPDKTTPGTSSATDYEQYSYDDNSNVTSLRGRNGQSTTLAYDNLNRLVGRSYPTTADNVAFSYDLLNRRTASSFADSSHAIAYTWDNAGRLASAAMTDATIGTKTLSYQYDAASNRTRITWPEATPFYVTTSYDALNRPTVIKELGTTNLATYAYDDLSRRTTVTLGNGAVTTYGYTTQSALASIDHNLTGSSQDNTWTYTRNQAQEIVTQAFSNSAYQWAGYANGTVGYTANGLNQYTAIASATPTYDTNGNLTGEGTWTYGYDQDNRLRTASKTGVSATLRYDPEGRMRQTDFGPFNIRNLLYDGTDLVSMYNATGNVMHRYVFGPGIDEPIVWYEGPVTGAKTWLFADHLGSIVALDGSSTGIKTYGPYGEPLPASAAGDRFRYTGQQMVSELGLYYYKARFYSPALGRFLQTDPVGYQSDLNLYAYVGNDPVNLTDPTGPIGINLGAAGIGAIIGGVSAGITAYGNGASPLGIGASILIGAGTGAASGFAVGPIAAIVTSGLAGGYGNLISQKFTSDKDTNFGDAGVAILTSAGGGAASVLAKAGGFGTAVQAGFGGSVTAISQGLVDLRAAANNNYPASGMVLNNPNNISVNNFSSMPVSRSGGYIKP
jgi:RHS repeat-associated protein